jgi:hypothetical protein
MNSLFQSGDARASRYTSNIKEFVNYRQGSPIDIYIAMKKIFNFFNFPFFSKEPHHDLSS